MGEIIEQAHQPQQAFDGRLLEQVGVLRANGGRQL
jgi:hypothetical protein